MQPCSSPHNCRSSAGERKAQQSLFREGPDGDPAAWPRVRPQGASSGLDRQGPEGVKTTRCQMGQHGGERKKEHGRERTRSGRAGQTVRTQGESSRCNRLLAESVRAMREWLSSRLSFCPVTLDTANSRIPLILIVV